MEKGLTNLLFNFYFKENCDSNCDLNAKNTFKLFGRFEYVIDISWCLSRTFDDSVGRASWISPVICYPRAVNDVGGQPNNCPVNWPSRPPARSSPRSEKAPSDHHGSMTKVVRWSANKPAWRDCAADAAGCGDWRPLPVRRRLDRCAEC